MSALVDLLLAEMTDEQAVELAERLRPFLNGVVDAPDLLTPTEAARRLQVSSRTLTRAAAAGRVPGATRVGRGWRFAADRLALRPPPSSRPPPSHHRHHADDQLGAPALRQRSRASPTRAA